MAAIMLRLSVLLFVIVAVGAIGLNRSINPQNVGRIQAHNIAIEITGTGGTLQFAGAIDCDADALAPNDTCLALLSVQNTGDFAVTMSAPDMDVGGGLTTCGGGGWFDVALQNVSYAGGDIVAAGETETFEVLVELDFDTPNSCQGRGAEISITITADCVASDVGCPAVITTTPTPTPVSEVAGVVDEPDDLISETLPSRFPVTGQGDFADDVAGVVALILLGCGLLAAGLLLIAAGLYSQRRREEQ